MEYNRSWIKLFFLIREKRDLIFKKTVLFFIVIYYFVNNHNVLEFDKCMINCSLGIRNDILEEKVLIRKTNYVINYPIDTEQ